MESSPMNGGPFSFVWGIQMRKFGFALACVAGFFLSALSWAQPDGPSQALLVPKLSPPGWILDAKLKASFGKTPGVSVGDFEVSPPSSGLCWFLCQPKKGTIPIHASTQALAESLAWILISPIPAGNLQIDLEFYGPDGRVNPKDLHPNPAVDLVSFIAQQIETSLSGNPHFVMIHRLPAHMPLAPMLSVEFSSEVIQFYDDNLQDYYGLDTWVAAQLFDGLIYPSFFNGVVPVAMTTTPLSQMGLGIRGGETRMTSLPMMGHPVDLVGAPKSY